MSSLAVDPSCRGDPHHRYQMPAAAVHVERSRTTLTNAAAVARCVDRPVAGVMAWVGHVLQVPARSGDGRWYVKGWFEATTVQPAIDAFVEAAVLCGQCRNPETALWAPPPTTRKARPSILRRCRSCGYDTPCVPPTATVRRALAPFPCTPPLADAAYGGLGGAALALPAWDDIPHGAPASQLDGWCDEVPDRDPSGGGEMARAGGVALEAMDNPKLLMAEGFQIAKRGDRDLQTLEEAAKKKVEGSFFFRRLRAGYKKVYSEYLNALDRFNTVRRVTPLEADRALCAQQMKIYMAKCEALKEKEADMLLPADAAVGKKEGYVPGLVLFEREHGRRALPGPCTSRCRGRHGELREHQHTY
eukprot:TRINITY_DN1644_c0_g2_i2.p1 TRINITY_DN1644_c0_g2~~TRINITY_DN1644_c0_g2_i2.p1  ORF type:complete len:360 (+),score=80.07 TRINITY_DN1644_c0_g2_i2:80-1159(+)